MNWLDVKYSSFVSVRLDKFKRVRSSGISKFRCPYCGDSEKRKNRARGYFYHDKNVLWYKCHNCGIARTFQTFLKELFPDIYKEYMFEFFQENAKDDGEDDASLFKMSSPIFKKISFLEDFPTIKKSLDSDGAKYLAKRKIPFEFLDQLYWVEDANDVIKKCGEKYADRLNNEKKSAVMLPFLDLDKSLMFVQLRYIDNGSFRYQTLEVNGGDKIWGLDRIDLSQTIYVFEGAFDAMFCPNAVGAGGADMIVVHDKLTKLGAKDIRFVWDIDYKTNKEVFNRVKKAATSGFSVVLVDHDLPGKDLNEAVINGFPIENVSDYLNSRTFKGLDAELKLGVSRQEKSDKPVVKRKKDINFWN